MSNNIKIVVAVLVGAVVGLGVSAVIPRESALGGVYNQVSNSFRDGIKVGTSDQFQVSSTGAVSSSAAITTSGTFSATGAFSATAPLGVGSTSPSSTGEIVADGTGTTTLILQSSTAGKGTCLQLENDLGVQTKAYIHGTTWVIAAGACK